MSAVLRTLLLLALLGVTFVCCLPSLDAPFTHDEDAGIAANRAVHPGATLRQAAVYRFSPDQTRPLFFVTLLLEARIHGLAPRGYRVVSLLMHLACGVAVYALLRRLRPPAEGAAFAGTAFFLLHPLQSESIIYIWGRSGVQSALLALLALLAVPWPEEAKPRAAEARTTRGMARWAAAAALMVLALTTKEEAVVLPLIALVWWLFAEGREARPALARAAFLALPAAAFVAIRPWVVGAVGRQVFARSVADNLLGQAIVTLRLIRLTLFPAGQSFDPAAAVPPLAAGLFAALVCCGFVTLAVVVGFQLRPPSPTASVFSRSAATDPQATASPVTDGVRRICAGVLVGAAGCVLYWLVPLPDLMSERRVYLPLVGGALVVYGLVTALTAGRPALSRPALAWLPALVVTLALAPALHARSRVWSDPRQVWEEASRLAPRRVRPYIDLGVMAAEGGDHEGAAVYFDRAIALEPRNPEALYNRGKLRLDAGDLAGAAADLQAAAEADPGALRARVNLAIVRIRQGDLDHAEEELRTALAIDRDDPRALTNLAEVLRARGRADEAIDLYRHALAADPAYAHAAARLGVALEARGDVAGALAAYRDYIARGPESPTDRAAVEAKIRTLSGGTDAPRPNTPAPQH